MRDHVVLYHNDHRPSCWSQRPFDSIYDQVQAEILVRPLKRVQVKGRKTEFMIYELLALRASDDPELRISDRDEQLSAMTWHALQKFEAGDFPAAEYARSAVFGFRFV
jgi:hypothetical protein